ncbi:AAA-ATPase At3g50940-like [Phragmites australis]|uniref:AAA-ATPase At3g50940-like n=1 Tax=Phragmites australis TaxID=29695 RepID=UPI002D7A12E8|nr:AAA-ATPase At3g50940-like [Phragmites australis]
MDHLPLTAPAAAASLLPAQGGRVLDAYKKALATAASAAAYAVLARSMARELFPDELRAAVRWCAAVAGARFGRSEKERHTVVIQRQFDGGYNENHLFNSARAYLATRIDPRAMRRLCLARSRANEPDGDSSGSTLLCMEPGGSTTDVFDGVEFMWTSVETGGEENKKGESLELSFDAEHTDTALERYVPFVMSTAEQLQLRHRALRIFMNEGRSWDGISHHHPATFDTIAMDPALKQSIVADLDRFLKRKYYYQRIGKAWKRGYLLYGPPGTGKSSLVAAMANYLRFDLYDLDLSMVYNNSALQRLLIGMPNKSMLVIEDIDCCFDAAASREDGKAPGPDDGPDPDYTSDSQDAYQPGAPPPKSITLSGLLNFIDGLWSTCGEERIIVFTTNYKDRLDPALLRPGRMDMHIYMGYCGWEAFRTLARNYFLVDDHALFPEIQELLSALEVTPAEVSEMLLRSEDVDVALRVLADFLQEKRRSTLKETEDKKDVAETAV